MYLRRIALASLIAGSVALPALAQTVTPDTAAPAPKADSAIPDAGVKKAPAAPAKRQHHATRLVHKTKTASPAKAR